MICLFVAAAASLTGCITFLTEIRLKGDGSGTIVQTTTMNPAQMRETVDAVARKMGAALGESGGDPAAGLPKDALKERAAVEEEFKGKAADMGTGVTVVSVEEIDTKTAAGVRVTYAFSDISRLSMNPKPEAALGISGAGASSKDALKFTFKRLPNGNALLTIVLPPPKAGGPIAEAEPKTPAPAEASEEQTALVRQMFRELHLGVSVDVGGRIVKTNSPYVEGSRVIIADFDFDPLLSNEKSLRELNEKMKAAEGDDLKTMEILKGIKGFKVTTAREISIEFTPK